MYAERLIVMTALSMSTDMLYTHDSLHSIVVCVLAVQLIQNVRKLLTYVHAAGAGTMP
jgi:hypothetical protein